MKISKKFTSTNSVLAILLSLSLALVIVITPTPIEAQKQQVTLTAIVAEPKERWDILFKDALQKLRQNHPDMDIQIDYRVLPYDATRTQILTALVGRTPIDLISVDQPWLGEFAEGGFLTDLTQYANTWGRESDWYPTNWDGGKYNNKVYGIWAWTDIRAMWYGRIY